MPHNVPQVYLVADLNAQNFKSNKMDNKEQNLDKPQKLQLNIPAVSSSCLICEKEMDKETIEHGNGTCSEYCNAKFSGYPMPSDYSVGLQKLVDNCC